MLGAIIGDMAGMPYEYDEFLDTYEQRGVNEKRRKRILDSNVKLIKDEAFVSDDTMLTVAIADAIINNKSYRDTLREYGMRYDDIRYEKGKFFERPFSCGFTKWFKSDFQKNGTSRGNGSAMRVSPVGFLFDDLITVQEEAKKSAIPSHDSEEAITGAQSIASSIYLARRNFSKEEIKKYLEDRFHINLNYDLESLRKTNTYISTCKEPVEHAIFTFLESNSFEDSIRKAISIGGDTDTIACMNGAIAEAYYGIPEQIRKESLKHIPIELAKVVYQEYEYRKDKNRELIKEDNER